jgi:hypothetical protein
MGDRLRERKEKDGYETDSSGALMLGQAARRRMSPSKFCIAHSKSLVDPHLDPQKLVNSHFQVLRV